MLPSEWYSQFGGAFARQLELAAGEVHVIPPNVDRYLIGWLGADVVSSIAVNTEGTLPTARFQFGPNTSPILFTHAIHGSLVNLGWRIVAGGAPCRITVVEAFARPPERSVQNGRVRNARYRRRGAGR